MLTTLFWQATAERAVKTFAEVLAAAFGAGSFGLLDAPWQTGVSLAGMAALLSVLASLGSYKAGSTLGPSLVGERLTSAPKPLR